MWFAIVGKRTVHGTTARTRSPAAKPSPSKSERLVVAEPVAPRRSSAARAGLLVLDAARVGDLAAALGIERRLAQLARKSPSPSVLERADLREHVGLLVADELASRSRRRANSAAR